MSHTNSSMTTLSKTESDVMDVTSIYNLNLHFSALQRAGCIWHF
jgi:hypothetical protein